MVEMDGDTKVDDDNGAGCDIVEPKGFVQKRSRSSEVGGDLSLASEGFVKRFRGVDIENI
nr:hypothetical protein [Tanacetum cinerariifolium]